MKTRRMLMVSLILCSLLVIAVLLGCGYQETGTPTPSPDNDEFEYPEIKLVSSDVAAEDNAISITTRFFIDELIERSGGRIQVEENWGGTLAGIAEAYEAIATGQAHFGTIATIVHPSELPLFQISIAVPFGARTPREAGEAMALLREKRPEFQVESEKADIVVLYSKGTENYNLLANQKITSIDQFKGEKVGVGGVYFPSWFEAVGAVTVAATSPEAYQNLKTNVYSHFWAFDSTFVQFSLYEVRDYLLEMNGGARCTQALVFNKEKFDSLDPQTQELIRESAQVSYEKYNAWIEEKIETWRQNLIDNGVNIITLSDSEREAWGAKIIAQQPNSIDRWIEAANAAGYDGEGIMADYLQILLDLGYDIPYDVSGYLK